MLSLPPSCKACGQPIHLRQCPHCGARLSCDEAFRRQHQAGAELHRWWAANPGPQTEFLRTKAFDVLYGGAAGGGKTAALAAMPLRWVHYPEFRAIGFRRETPQLKNLLDEASAVYRITNLGPRRNLSENSWTFPSGATVRFTHLKEEKDAADHDGQQYQVVLWDELTHFSETQYKALLSRIRSPNPELPGISRATTNPGGVGGAWVFRRWGPWLDPEWEPDHRYQPTHGDGTPLVARFAEDGRRLPPAFPGEVLYYIDTPDGCEYVPRGTPDVDGIPAATRQFIPARLADNPVLLRGNPSYRQKLRGLDPLRRAQLLEGDWLAKAAAGLLFKRQWFETVDAAPARAWRIRFWDRASTVPEKGKDPDWTVGCKLAMEYIGRDALKRDRFMFYIEHVVRMRGTPAQVANVIESTAIADAEEHGRKVSVVLAKDPGQAGVSDVEALLAMLSKFDAHPWPESGDKVTRSLPVSAQCEQGNVKIVRGPWNNAFLDVLEGFPDGDHDDDVDALSGAYNFGLENAPVRIPPATNRGESRWEDPSSRGF